MTVSGGEQKDSAIHTHVSILPQTPLLSRLSHTLSRVPCQHMELCDPVGPCWSSVLNIAVSTCFLSRSCFFLVYEFIHMKNHGRTSLVLPGGLVLKNPPANAETLVQSLVWEDSTCHGVAKPMYHNYGSLSA